MPLRSCQYQFAFGSRPTLRSLACSFPLLREGGGHVPIIFSVSCSQPFQCSAPRNHFICIACTALSCCSCGLKVVKFSKSVHIESATCARTSATLISPITSLKFSTARTPPAPPYPTNPATLLFHSWKRKSIAFFNAAEVAWLY